MSLSDRFIKVSAKGLLLPRSAKSWVAVHEPAAQITYTRHCLSVGAVQWDAANAACADLALFGWTGRWRQIARLEWAHLIEDQRYRPVLDPDFFTTKSSEYGIWLGTECAPAECAWAALLVVGASYRNRRSDHLHVRGCCPSQVSGFSVQVLAA